MYGAVQRWYISDPAAPDEQPREVRYPAAGTPNAVVELHVLALDGASIDVAWDRDRFPYLTAVHWVSGERLLLQVQSRDQRDIQVLEANPRQATHRRSSSTMRTAGSNWCQGSRRSWTTDAWSLPRIATDFDGC